MSLEQFSNLISASTHNFSHPLPAELLLASEGDLQTFYAPFDHINLGARIVVCGITPGLQQTRLSSRWACPAYCSAVQRLWSSAPLFFVLINQCIDRIDGKICIC